MRRFLHSRLLRCFVCFFLICCFLINCSPIRTEAIAIGATVVTGSAAAGILGLLFSMAMGVVFVELTADKIVSVGENLSAFLADYYADDQETTNSVTGYLNDLTYSFGGSGDDGTGNGDNDNKITLMPDTIAAGLVAWILHMYKKGGFEAFGEEAAPGYTFYGEHCLVTAPATTDSLPYATLLYSPSTGAYRYYLTSLPLAVYTWSDGDIDLRTQGTKSTSQASTLSDSADVSWTVNSVQSNSTARLYNLTSYGFSIVWSNCDIVDYTNYDLVVFEGSPATNVQKEIVVPDIYVGDIPQQIEDGSYDEDDLKLPYINHGNLFGNHTNYVDALNDVSTQLKDGSMTYDQYMDQIQTEGDSGDNSGSGDGTGEDSGGNSGGSSGPVDSMLPYALDLTDFFPFCIPFDLYDLYSSLAAAPETPVFDLKIAGYTVTVDLSPWDDFAAYFRRLQLLLFVIGLAASSRKFIKW